MARSLSLKRRFTVFKRDLFVCQYCGRSPPNVVLEVDHILSVSEGGTSEEHNLLTSCFDCNRGKGAGGLKDFAHIDIKKQRSLLLERIAQTREYEILLTQQREAFDDDINSVVAVYEATFEGWTLLEGARISIRRFLGLLPPSIVIEAMEIACARVNKDRAFRYFCGVCWHKVGPRQ